ncbi:uncharacterized protein BXZ73DRAFT_39325 [Epithele typhae]|uniref:uncharacterized protein n=1 Tax=Epithele typhae TaxID=378194 RepID=UPI0020072D62|nr:uncharacterized protein BXZ73DRAFT_39325 [Epithele typhae]KAH9944260.1 hypothetical protein BXZ73DRAFT_39325 [Epithele typhae]
MAEPGPGASSSTQPESPHQSSVTSTPLHRATHIHFPVDPLTVGNENGHHSLGLGPPPLLRGKSGIHSGPLLPQQDEKRRRVKSVDASAVEMYTTRESAPSRRTTNYSRRLDQRDATVRAASNVLTETFSDEYDLYPGVLEDVQRALKLKARREARLRTQSSPLRVESHPPSDDISLSSSPSVAVPVNLTSPLVRPVRLSGDSEIDFSPSIGVVPFRAIPSSSDGGATLDWSSSPLEDARDRRWSLSRSKRKSKDQASFNGAFGREQEAHHASKLKEIRSGVSPLTLRKAEMIKDQLRRKYEVLFSKSKSPSPTLLEVRRWYHNQGEELRSTLDQAEPLTWMKHLWDSQESSRPKLSSWSPTALVFEEYASAHSARPTMDTIPENDVVLPSSPYTTSFSDARSPTSSSYSWATPRHSLEAAISLARTSYDAQVSFEPLVESGRDSLGPDSRRSSDNYKAWPVNGGDSAQSSLYSVVSKGASPNSSRKRLRELRKRLALRPSDEALSSARNSLSENSGHSASEEGGNPMRKLTSLQPPRSRPTSLHMHSPNPSAVQAASDAPTSSEHSDIPATATQSSTRFPGVTDASLTPRPESASKEGAHSTFLRRKFRRSLPSANGVFAQQQQKRRRSANEEKEREEYEVKAQLLEDTLSQNYRVRHLLQRVCGSIRDYDSLQAGLSTLLGIQYSRIPSEVLDALLHDPAAITGGTRSSKSWVAVEDIHARIQRQRETLHDFIHLGIGEVDGVAPPCKVFDEPVSKLLGALETLSSQREALAHHAEDVATVLKRVKAVQAEVKREYNDALSHTSLVYPELSQIAALEENYRNHYQQFWDIGLDALTFFLDTMAPFWRNYGKIIGEDVQDFLIVPWYRNEFTGEPKRYLITQLPQRSFRHWGALLALSFSWTTGTILQARGAVYFSSQIHLPWIDHSGLWSLVFPVYITLLAIQWCAVVLEVAVIFAQLGIIVWWLGWSVNLFT